MNVRSACSLMLLCLCLSVTKVFSQPSNAVFANVVNGKSGSTVSNASNAAKFDNTYAELTAGTFTVFSTDAWLELGYDNEVVKGSFPTTLYIRISTTSPAFLNNMISVNAYNGNGSPVSLSGGGYKTFYTPDGNAYLAVSPSGNFKKVRVTVSPPALLGEMKLRIYYAFYGPTASNETNPYPFTSSDCGAPNVTSKAFTEALLGAYNVENPGGAIDNDLNTKSSFATNGVVLDGFIKQTFHFNGPSNPSDGIRVVLSQSGSLLALDLGKSISLTAYNGNDQVGDAVFMSSLLRADLLTLLENKSQIAFYVQPTGTFDRVEINLNVGLLGVGLGSNALNIHDVRRAPAMPTAPDVSVCTNIGTVLLSALSPQNSIQNIGSFAYKWYKEISGTTTASTSQQWSLLNLTTAGEQTYYVETVKSGTGCISSDRKAVKINVQNPPVTPDVALTP